MHNTRRKHRPTNMQKKSMRTRMMMMTTMMMMMIYIGFQLLFLILVCICVFCLHNIINVMLMCIGLGYSRNLLLIFYESIIKHYMIGFYCYRIPITMDSYRHMLNMHNNILIIMSTIIITQIIMQFTFFYLCI